MATSMSTTTPPNLSRSLFFAQSAHEAIVEQHSGLKAVGRITDFAPRCRLKVGGMCHLQCVDNFAALGGDAESTAKVMENVGESMGRRGLLMREHEDAGTGMAALLGHVIKAVKGLQCSTLPDCGVCQGWLWK